MTSTYVTMAYLRRDEREAMGSEADEWLSWLITEKVKDLGYTPAGRGPSVRWRELTATEVHPVQPEFVYERGDWQGIAKIEVAEDVDPLTAPTA